MSSKNYSSYSPPTGPPPEWSKNQSNSGYVPQAQPAYHNEERGSGGYYQQGYQQQGYGGYPQQGYQEGYAPQQGYPQQHGQYGGYQQPQYQQQPMYVQQQQSSNNQDCLMACLAAMCVCCTLDMLF